MSVRNKLLALKYHEKQKRGGEGGRNGVFAFFYYPPPFSSLRHMPFRIYHPLSSHPTFHPIHDHLTYLILISPFVLPDWLAITWSRAMQMHWSRFFPLPVELIVGCIGQGAGGLGRCLWFGERKKRDAPGTGPHLDLESRAT